MSAVKVGAHPLVVAVAMGLLGPSALMEIDERDDTRKSTSATSVSGGLFDAGPSSEVPEPPSEDEFARVEHLWHEVRTNIE